MTRDSPALHLFVLLVLLIAGFFFHLRLGGLEPALWLDTVFDSQAVAACLEEDRCPVRGAATSVPGLRHGTTWLHFRTLASWVGLPIGAFHVLMHLAGALTFVLTAIAAARVAGPWAGVSASLVLAALNVWHDCAWTAVYNNRILPLLGTLAWALCMAAVVRRRIWPLVLGAGVAALTTEVHVVFLLSGGCLAASALLMPRRWRALVFALGTYGLMVVALSWETWMSNAAALSGGGVDPSPYAGGEVAWRPSIVEGLAIAGVAILALGLVVGRGESRRGLVTQMAFVAPFLIVYEAAVLAGVTTQTDKYFGAWLGGVAASIACGAFTVADRAREILSRVGTTARQPLLAAGGRISTVLQCVVAASVAVWPGANLRESTAPGDLPYLRMEDARRVARAAESRGWTLEQTVARLRCIQGHEMIQWIPLVWASEVPAETNSNHQESLTVLRVPPSWVPGEMPAGWEFLDRGEDSVLMAMWNESWIDWDLFEVCRIGDRAESDCHETRLLVSKRIKVEENQTVIPHWPGPAPGFDWPPRGMIELRLRVRFPPHGGEQRVFMPALMRGCAGRVIAVPGVGSEVSPDGRFAVIRSDGTEDKGTLVLRWRVGDRDCPTYAWPYGIPFFVEAAPDHARLIEGILGRGRPP